MKVIFEYTNYRSYLKDYYDEQKAENGFTYRDFAELTGMNSTSWLLHLIKGTKNLSVNSSGRVSRALKLGKTESEYFDLMVLFTQAKTNEVKDHYFQKLLAIKRKLKMVKINEEQYEYYTKWYHPVLRSLVSKVDFSDPQGGYDFAKLAHCLIPPIPAREARGSVELLEKLGLIARGEDGKYIQTNSVISTGDEVSSLNVINYHKEVSRLAEGAHDVTAKEERDITALTLGIGHEDFLRIKARLQAFRKEIMDIAQASEKADRVYQLNFQLFPVAKGVEP